MLFKRYAIFLFWLSGDMARGEVIGQNEQTGEDKRRKTYMLRTGIASPPERRVWVQYKEGEHDASLRSILSSYSTESTGNPPVTLHYDFPDTRTFVITAAEDEVVRMENDPLIERVVEDSKRFPMYMKDSIQIRELQEGQEVPYGIRMVQADQAWQAGVTGAGVKVCVIDTGIDRSHEDFVTDRLTGLDTMPEEWYIDGVGHGTHCSGTIAAADNGIGVIGVAPDAEIFTVKVFDDDGSFVYSSGLVDAAKQCQSNGAKIISMSLGGPLWNPFEFREFEKLFNQGVLSVAAAGNSGTSRFSYPASYNGVLSVAAIDESKTVASFSQKNSKVDLAAPGVDVLSTLPMDPSCQICEDLEPATDTYGIISGTSMATPHVSGVAALLWSYLPDADIEDVKDALESSVEDLGSNGRDDSYGFGLVQALDALVALNGGPVEGIPNPPSPGRCEDDEILLELSLKTDEWGRETFWQVTRDVDNFPVLAGAKLDDNRLYQTKDCLPADCYTFTILDSAGDGLCCGYGEGSYSVSVNDAEVGSGGSFTDQDTVSFGKCSGPPDTKPEPTLPATIPPTGPCADLLLNFTTDQYPAENTITLTHVDTKEVIWAYGGDDGIPLEINTSYEETVCIDRSGCFLFEITDSYGDGMCCVYGQGGFELVYDGNKVAEGTSFGSSVSYNIGGGCTNFQYSEGD